MPKSFNFASKEDARGRTRQRTANAPGLCYEQKAYGLFCLYYKGVSMNRDLFLCELGPKYLPQIVDLHARLQANPPARIADIGCGMGWSTIGIAQAYPKVRVDGFDLDAALIEDAWATAHHYGLTDRVTFHARDGADPLLNGRYDLVTVFEYIHDLGDPVGVLRTMRRLAGEEGVALVMDKRVGDTFATDENDVAWMLRLEKVQRYALEAGFRRVEVLPIISFIFRFYRLYLH
jgi:SAM-dependent methyltransferase